MGAWASSTGSAGKNQGKRGVGDALCAQVMSLLEWKELMDDPRARSIFPGDAIERAKRLSSAIPGGIGAYSDSRGIQLIRENVAEFIQRRDGWAGCGLSLSLPLFF